MTDPALQPPALFMSKKRLRQLFVAGLLVWLPLVISVWVLLWLLGMVDSIFIGTVRFLARVVPPVDGFSQWVQLIPGFGVLVVIAVVLLTGMLVTNMVGAWWLKQWNRMLIHIPVFRSIYTSVKQVSDTLFSGSGKAFSKALLVQYPRQGAWTVAFLTGAPGGEVASYLPGEYVSVYVPTTPNPTSGFFLMMPRSDVIELHMTVDEALKYIISMGVVVPADAVHLAQTQGALPHAATSP